MDQWRIKLFKVSLTGGKASSNGAFGDVVPTLANALSDTGHGFFSAVRLQKNQLHSVACSLPRADAMQRAAPDNGA